MEVIAKILMAQETSEALVILLSLYTTFVCYVDEEEQKFWTDNHTFQKALQESREVFEKIQNE